MAEFEGSEITIDKASVMDFLLEEKRKCIGLMAEYRNITSQSRHCPPYFDGLLCWPYTKPSDIAILPCPSETGPLNQLDPATNSALNSDTPVATMATKTCLSNGQWGSNSENIRESNYSLCKLSDEFIDRLLVNLGFRIVLFRDYKNFESLLNKWLPIVRIVSQIGYSTSFAMLITAMIIFSLLRKLRNPRNRLHMHLFASFIMRAFMTLVRDWIFIDDISRTMDIIYVENIAFIKQRNVGLNVR